MTFRLSLLRQNILLFFRVATLIFACPSFSSAAQPHFTWRWSHPMPHGNNIADMMETNGFYVQVGERGQIYTSDDFQTWLPRQSHTTNALRAVTFFGTRIVAVGENGTVVYGDAADQLQSISLNTTDWLEGIAGSPALLIGVGDNGAIHTSPDGANWQRQPVAFGTWLRSVAYGTPSGADTFVAVGEDGFVANSSNGANWQAVGPIATEHLNKVSWINGQFLAVGEGGVAFTSLDGRSWLAASTGATNALYAVAVNSSSLLLAGDSEVRLEEGRDWTDQFGVTFPPPHWAYLSALWDNTSFVLGGRTGMMVEGFKTNASSPTIWLPLSDSPREWLWDTKRMPNLYIAVGDRATILTSIDGQNWAQELPADFLTDTVFLGIGGSTDLAVAVGSGGSMMVSPDVLESLVSTNSSGAFVTNQVSTLGIFWYAIARPVTNDLQGVTFFNGSFVVSGGAGTILTSPDGTNWTKRMTPSSSFLSSVEAFPGGVVAVGKGGTILRSSDSVNWTARMPDTTNWIYRVRYLGGGLVAVGQNGTILTSPDGTQWTTQSSGTSRWLNDVQLVDKTYFAVGTQGTVLTSTDLITWQNIGTITGKSLYAAASSNGRLVVAGVEGAILRTQVAPFTSPVGILRYPTNAAENVFLFTGQPDQQFSLDRSTNLVDWISGPQLELTDPSGTLIQLDSGTNHPTIQFYRTRAPK